MRVFLFVLASVMGANSAFAQSSAERAMAAKRALTQCEDKAVKDKKAGNAFVARLGVCIKQFRLARDLEAALMAGRGAALGGRMASAEGALVGMSGRVVEVERGVVSHDRQIKKVTYRVDDLLENAPRAELVVGGVNHDGDVAGAFGVGLSLPVAKGEWLAEVEALGSVRSDSLGFGGNSIGFTLIGRGTTFVLNPWDFPLVWGPNLRYQVEGPAYSQLASAVFMGAGPSAGWQGGRFGVIADVSVGFKLRRRGDDVHPAWASGLLAQVKF